MELNQQKIQNVKMNYEIINDTLVCNIFTIEEEKSVLIFTYEYNLKLKKGSVLKYKELSLPEIKQILNIIVNRPLNLEMFLLYLKRYQHEYSQIELIANKLLKSINGNNDILRKALSIIHTVTDNKDKSKPIKAVIASEKAINNEDDTYFKTYTIQILRENSTKWESIYNHDSYKYYEFEEPHFIDEIHEHVKLNDEDIINLISLLKTEQEFRIVSEYLKLYQRDETLKKNLNI